LNDAGTPWLESLPSSQLAEELNAIQNYKILSSMGDNVQVCDTRILFYEELIDSQGIGIQLPYTFAHVYTITNNT
jgi:hypothetical protein